jgi:hypothetical protein
VAEACIDLSPPPSAQAKIEKSGKIYSSCVPASGRQRKLLLRHLRLHFIISVISNNIIISNSNFVDTCALYQKHFSSERETLDPGTRPEGNGKNFSNVVLQPRANDSVKKTSNQF